MNGISEAEWKLFKPLREAARIRWCERVLGEIDRIRSDAGKDAYERYLEIDALMNGRDKELARIFDFLRRSTALLQLEGFYFHDLITAEELARFSADTRETVERFVARVRR